MFENAVSLLGERKRLVDTFGGEIMISDGDETGGARFECR